VDEATLREQLDRASLQPRGHGRERWQDFARAFAAPAWDLVAMCLEDEAEIGAADAQAFVQSPAGPFPFASRLAWRRALLQFKGQSKEVVSDSIKALLARMREVTDARVVAPLVLAGLQEPLLGISELRHAVRRHRWLDGMVLGAELGVACLLLPGPEEFRSMAFGALGRMRTLALGARAAMWVAIWNDPSSLEHDWFALGTLGEPAAVAVLADDVEFSVERLAPRLASTLALVRIIAGEDPWLAQKRVSRYSDPELPERVFARALTVLPWAALLFGGVDQARAVLAAELAPQHALQRAIALGLLGEASAVPALVEALGDPACPDGVFQALAMLGQAAHPALARLEAMTDRSAVVARAAILENAEALRPLVEEDLVRAQESREQYLEGLITEFELAQQWWRVATCARLWRMKGPTAEQGELLERAKQELAQTPRLERLVRLEVSSLKTAPR
jgi:hypothetical protein